MYLYIVSRYTTDVLQNIGERETTAMMDEEEEVVENRSKLCRMRIYSPPESCILIESNGTINSLNLRSISYVFIVGPVQKMGESTELDCVIGTRTKLSYLAVSHNVIYASGLRVAKTIENVFVVLFFFTRFDTRY